MGICDLHPATHMWIVRHACILVHGAANSGDRPDKKKTENASRVWVGISAFVGTQSTHTFVTKGGARSLYFT